MLLAEGDWAHIENILGGAAVLVAFCVWMWAISR